MKGISRIIDALVSKSRSSKVTIDSDGLLERLAKSDYKPKHWWEIHYQNGLRLTLVLSAIIMMITVFFYYGFRYINDVVLYENQLIINDQGAFYPRKSLNCEYALYLFNTADLWANSGVLVNKNDRVKISISGGYNSWVDGIIEASKKNTEPKFNWISYDGNSKPLKSLGIDYCISRGNPNFDFGSAMYAIVPESQGLRSNPTNLEKHATCLSHSKNGSMFVWKNRNSNKFHKAGETGTLFFAVNDMYFDNNESIEKYFTDSVSIAYYGQEFCEKAIRLHKDNPEFDYKDNLGQLLVSIEIQRHVPYGIFRPMIVYRWLEYKTFETIDTNKSPFIKVVICFVWFGLFCIWITILFALYMLTLFFIIYILFFLGHRFFKLIDRIFPEKTVQPSKD